jgi:hypothetical protein
MAQRDWVLPPLALHLNALRSPPLFQLAISPREQVFVPPGLTERQRRRAESPSLGSRGSAV